MKQMRYSQKQTQRGNLGIVCHCDLSSTQNITSTTWVSYGNYSWREVSVNIVGLHISRRTSTDGHGPSSKTWLEAACINRTRGLT